ncbi:unnamed protein product [Effrenium voratum]|nr:unnamed protein product [Effrenium voratum]
MAPQWWPAFKRQLQDYVAAGCPAADSTVFDSERVFEDARPQLNQGQLSLLKKELAKRIIDACRAERLLETFAEKALGESITSKALRQWKEKAVVAAFYKCSATEQASVFPARDALATRLLTDHARQILVAKGAVFEEASSAAIAPSMCTPQKEKLEPTSPPPPSSGEKAASGSGRKREVLKNLECILVGHCHDEGDVHKVMHQLENRLQQHFPDIWFHHRDFAADVSDSKVLQRLGQLRDTVMERGQQQISVQELDKAVSQNGQINTDLLQSHGYRIGARAKRRLQTDDCVEGKRGRPRIYDRPEMLDLARKVLGKHSKPGSKIVAVEATESGHRRYRGKTAAETAAVPAVSLLAMPSTIYDSEPQLREKMAAPTCRKMLRECFGEYRVGSRKTDMCTHCNTFHCQLVPDFKQFMQKARRDLEVVLPVYFRAWDAAGRAAEDAQNGDWAKVASALLKYIHTHHSRFQNERETLSRADRLTLFSEVEAPIELELKGRLSLLTAFQWHMVSARRQGEYFRSLIDKLAQEHYLMAYDFRQKLRLPLAPTETGPMWHCQQKVSLACWGGVFVKHSTKSTVAQPQVDLTFLLFLSEVVEQPAEASNLMLQEALNATGAPFSGTLQLWSDTGPHFRSAGNLFFYARKLCQARKQPIQIRWLAEQHGKSILDEMFAWTGTHRDGWLGKHAARFPIYNIDDMAQALKTGAAAQMQKDPSGPKWIVKKVRYPERRASVRQFLHAPSLKITGTYALDAEPHHGQAPVPPALVNRIFADSDDRCRVLDWKLETLTEDAPETWRKTFFDGPKPWEEEVDWRADHHLKRVYEAQRNRPPPRQILPTKTL